MLKKNEIIQLEIVDVTNEGNGVGKYEGMTVFVPMTAVRDIISCKIVKVKKSYCYAIIQKVLLKSSARQQDDCPVYSQCGGCCFRHINYQEECRIKAKYVKDSFERIGKIQADFEEILPCENIYNYRNKAQFPVTENNGKAICGFYAKRSHRVIENVRCMIQPEIFSQIAQEIISYANEKNIPAYNEQTQSGLLRQIYIRRGENSGEIMVCLVVTNLNKRKIFSDLGCVLTEKFKNIKSVILNENSKNTNVILGEKFVTIAGEDHISDIMCEKKILISPASFYQVNTIQAQKLYKIAQDYAQPKKEDILLDLYCGTGTIGLSMAEKVKTVMGVETVGCAIDNARQNAQANGIKNAQFFLGDAEKTALTFLQEGISPDIIIADPARKGCSYKTLECMAKMNPSRIIMISCNPATAARDCALLETMGFLTTRVKPVDMFPRTGHVETVVLMSRKDK